MSSILTNNGAMVALQTLKSINANLAKTQDLISTGKAVATAKDNAAVWAISKVMESDVQGFKAIGSSLSLGETTVSIAREASEAVTDLLTKMKDKIIASQEDNVDRGKIQDDIAVLRDQISSIVGAAQYNGLNLLSNRSATVGSGTIDVLSSLDRSGSGVTVSNISVSKQDLGMQASSINTGATVVTAANNIQNGFGDTVAAALTGAATAATGTSTFGASANEAVPAGTGFNISISALAGALPAELATTSLSDIRFVARDGDTAGDVAKGLAESFNTWIQDKVGTDTTIQAVASGNSLTFTGANVVGDNLSITVNQYAAADTTIGGGLEKLAAIDVSTDTGAQAALNNIEAMIQTSINSAAAFGSVQGRIEIQAEFVSKLTDALRSGIGSLVDADMEEASARLQALQVQQQLGIQSLSIANQAPQSILALFR